MPGKKVNWMRRDLLEPCAGKLARTVLRGGWCSDALSLPDGTRYIEVPTRKVKPSQTCSGCGRQAKKALSERQHTCSCGLTLSRDQNAARVLLNWALESIKGRESALCGEKSFSAKHETPSIPIWVGGM